MRQTMEEQYEAICGESTGFSSGFIDLDRIIGGFQKGSLNILASAPSMGKTALALNIAQFGGGYENEDSARLIFSPGTSLDQLFQRMFFSEAETSLDNIRNIRDICNRDVCNKHSGEFNVDECGNLLFALERLQKLPFLIDDKPMLTTMDIRARVDIFAFQHKNMGLIIVDDLALIRSSGGYRGGKSRLDDQETSEVVRELKSIACEYKCPILALSQLYSRRFESRHDKRPMFSDLRDAGVNEHEQDVDVVMMLYREEYYYGERDPRDEGSGEALLNVAKNRNGALGEIKLVFKREFGRFFNSMR